MLENRPPFSPNVEKAAVAELRQTSKDVVHKFRGEADAIRNIAVISGPSLLPLFTGNPNPELSLKIAGINALVQGIYGGYEHFTGKDKREDTALSYGEYGTSAIQLVYNGRDVIKVNGAELKSGDNFLLVHLPEPTGNTKITRSNEGQSALRDLSDLAVEALCIDAENFDYKGVVIYRPDEDVSVSGLRYNSAAKIDPKVLFQGKGLVVNNPSRRPFILSREQFEQLNIRPDDLFRRACEKLGNEQVLKLFDYYAIAQTFEEKGNLKKIFFDTINILLEVELNRQHNGPKTFVTDKDPYSHVQIREKVNLPIQLRNKYAEQLRARMLTDIGAIKQVDVSKLLEVDPHAIEQVIERATKQDRAQLIFAIHLLLTRHELDDLLQVRKLDTDDVFRRLAESGITLRKVRNPEELFIPKRVPESIGQGAKIAFNEAKRTLAPAVLSLFLATAAQTYDYWSDYLRQIPVGIGQHFSLGREAGDIGRFETIRPGFFDKLPEHRVDWNITGVGDIRTDGYYTVSTSHEITPTGEWIINNNRSFQLGWENGVGGNREGVPHILVEKRVARKDIPARGIKIPMRDGTMFYGLKITARDGNLVPYILNFLTDGTNEVEISSDFVGDWVDVQALLAEGIDSTAVRAAKKMQPINKSKITPDLRESVESISSSYFSDDFKKEVIALGVASSHDYSIDPQGKETVEKPQSPESLVNAIQALKGCDCDVCNAEAVLLSSLIPGSESKVNLAIGYLKGVDNPSAGEGEVLDAASYHGYEIDENGSIFDATPSTIANDLLTQLYIHPELWEESQRDMFEAQQLILLASGLALFTGGFYARRPIERRVRKVVNKKQAKEVADDLLLNAYSRDDLERDFDILSQLAYRKPGNPVRIQPRDNELVREKYRTKQEFLDTMREYHLGQGNFDDFFRPPHEIEQQIAEQFQLPLWQKWRLRGLARYIKIGDKPPQALEEFPKR